jgi:hypothetical protein
MPRLWFPPQTRSALFAVSIVFNYDGTATVMTDVVAAPATRTQTIPFQIAAGGQAVLAQFDTLLPDCSENKDFKALVTVMPKLGSLSGTTQQVVAQYDPATPQADCNGRQHQQVIILYANKNAGADSVTIRAGIGREVVDLVFDIRSE